MKKILYLCDFPIDSIGGAQKSLVTMANAMNEQQYDVYVTSENITNKDFLLNCHFKVLEFSKGNGKIEQVIRKLIFLLKIYQKIKPDIIHVQFAQYAYVLMLAKKLKLIKKDVRCIYTDRHFFTAYNQRYQKMFINQINDWNDIIFTTNINKQEWEKALYGKEYKTNFHVIYNVLDPEWFESNHNVTVNKDHNQLVIGFAGRYVDWKRWDTVEEICIKLLSIDDIKVNVAISYDKGNSSSEKDMYIYIEKLKKILNNRIEIFVNVDTKKMMQFYDNLDLFILTSEKESFGRTLIEAMSRNCSVLSANSGGAPEVIGRKDLLFSVGDVSTALSKILEYKNNFFKLENDKIYFKNRVNTLFTIDSMIKKSIQVYEGDMKC